MDSLSGLDKPTAPRSIMSNDTSFQGRAHSNAGSVSELRSHFRGLLVARHGNVAMAESVAPLVHSSGCSSRR